MSEVARRLTVVPMPDNRAVVTGTLAEVSAALDDMQRRGRLISYTRPTPTGEPGLVMTNCRLLSPERPMSSPRRRLSGRAWAAIIAAALAVLGGLAWLAYEVLELVVNHAVAIIGASLLAAFLFAGAGRVCTTHITVRHHH